VEGGYLTKMGRGLFYTHAGSKPYEQPFQDFHKALDNVLVKLGHILGVIAFRVKSLSRSPSSTFSQCSPLKMTLNCPLGSGF
jgi:hypothetical protein